MVLPPAARADKAPVPPVAPGKDDSETVEAGRVRFVRGAAGAVVDAAVGGRAEEAV